MFGVTRQDVDAGDAVVDGTAAVGRAMSANDADGRCTNDEDGSRNAAAKHYRRCVVTVPDWKQRLCRRPLQGSLPC